MLEPRAASEWWVFPNNLHNIVDGFSTTKRNFHVWEMEKRLFELFSCYWFILLNYFCHFNEEPNKFALKVFIINPIYFWNILHICMRLDCKIDVFLYHMYILLLYIYTWCWVWNTHTSRCRGGIRRDNIISWGGTLLLSCNIMNNLSFQHLIQTMV